MKKLFFMVVFLFCVFLAGNVKANTCPFTIEMEIGTKHEQVTLLQDFMKKVLLIYEGPTTGYFGGLSSNAIKVFQKNSGLLETGLFDSVTKSVFCQIYSSYNTDKNIAVPSQSVTGECFVKTLGLARGYFDKPADEVVELQKYLNQKGFYPENIVSGYFGILTEVALKKFQASVGIANTGIVDNQTFKAICGYESNQVIGCPFVTNNLSAGYFEEASNEVKALQMILVQLNLLDKQYQTGFFGKITTDAVKKFQEKVNLSQTGILNIETRTVLCDMIEMPLAKSETKSDNPKETPSSNVDIAISGVNIPVEKIDVNTKVPIIVRAKNIGSEKSTKFKSAIYMDDKLDATVETYELNPEQETIVMAHTWTCKQKGIYALKIFLDHDNQLIEQNKFNNVLVVPINCGNVKQEDFKYSCDTTKYQCVVSDKGTMLKEECEKTCKKETEADLPDLTVIEFKPNKTNVKVGEKITLSITEKNIGKTDAPVHQVKMLINKEESLANWPALGVGKQNINDTLEWVCNTAGTYTFTFTTNSDNKIKELSTTNNSRSFEIRCGAESSGGIFGDDGQGNQGGGTPPGAPGSGGHGGGSDLSDGRGTGSYSGGSESMFGGISDMEWENSKEKKYSDIPPRQYTPPEPTVSKVFGGICGGTGNINVGAKGCTRIDGRPNYSNPLPKGLSYFNIDIVDTVNYVDKWNGLLKQCVCSPSYRASPHKVSFTPGPHFCSEKETNCAIDFGDGSKVEYFTKADEWDPSYPPKKFHLYRVPAGQDYAIFCPKLIVDGKYYSLTSQIMNDYEDKEKCIIVFKRSYTMPPYHPAAVPVDDDPSQWGTDYTPCGEVTHHAKQHNRHWVNGNKVRIQWYLNVRGGQTYLNRCPAICRVDWGEFPGQQQLYTEVFPCNMVNEREHAYSKPGTYTITIYLSDVKDQDPINSCYSTQFEKVVVGEGTGKGATCNEETCFVCDPKKTESNKCVSMKKVEYTKEENKNLERYFTQQECKDKCKVVPSDDKKTLSCSVTGKLLPDILMPKFSSLVVGAEAKIEEKEKCNSWEYSWKNNFTFDQWTAYEKSNSKNFAKSIGLTENIKKDIVFTTKVRAKCGTTQLESECTFTIDKNGVVKPLSQNIVDENSIVAETTVKENWFTNLVTNIFKTTGNDQELTVNQNNKITIQSEKKYTCKSGTCVEASFGGTSLSECMKGCFSATFSNLFEGLISTVSTTKPTTAINLDTSKLSIPGFDNLITSNTTKPLTTFNFDNINFDFTGFNFTDQKPKTKEITTMPVHNFDNLINNFSSTNTYQAVKYKCNNNTGKCIIANNLDKNTYLSENECNKNCYTVSSFNTINSINSFNQFNLQTNQ